MASIRQHMPSPSMALWLVALLLQLQASRAATAAAVPLALALQGRSYSLIDRAQRLELPLGCPGSQALRLGLQHRVQLPLRGEPQQCSAALSVLVAGPQGTLASLWTQGQVSKRLGAWAAVSSGVPDGSLELSWAWEPRACPAAGR